MPLTQQALQGLLASATGVVYLECLTISHSEFPDGTIRIVNDNQSIIRNTQEFIAFPFQIQPSVQVEDEAPRIHITADMVDQQVIQALRAVSGKREKPLVKYEITTRGEPDETQWGPIEFSVYSVSTDGASIVEIEASYWMGLLEDSFPTATFTPGNREFSG